MPDRAWPLLMRYELIGPVLLAPLVLGLLALDLFTGGARLLTVTSPLANLIAIVTVGRPLE